MANLLSHKQGVFPTVVVHLCFDSLSRLIDLDRTSISSKSRLFPVRDTHQRTLRHRFSGACQLRCKQITQFRIVMCAGHAKFCACVKPTCFYHFREGSHTRANLQMRSMGIYRRFFFQQSAMMPFSVLRG